MEEGEQQPLDTLAIDWVQPRVCEETFENRRALREAGWRWRPVPGDPDTGMPSGLIEVPDPAVQQATMLARYRDCLVDSKDPWSDYVDVRHLPLDAVGVPYWVHKRAQRWEEWNESEGKPVESAKGMPPSTAVAKARKGKEPHLPTRCVDIKKDGTRCWGWAMDPAGDGRCRAHAASSSLANNMGHQIALAKIKVMQAMPAMADALEEMALTATSEPVRLKAITEMMDRGGVHASTDIKIAASVEATDPAAIIREKLSDLGERLRHAEEKRLELEGPKDVVDAEVVDDPDEERSA